MLDFKDTIEDMLSADAERRMRAEYTQLYVRLEKLKDYIKNHIRNDNSIEVQLKEKQLTYMTQYKNVLEMRAALRGYNLDK